MFAPVELLQCFGLNCTSVELLSSFLSGFYCEDTLIGRREEAGIAATLCSYHKNFIGASLLGLAPHPQGGGDYLYDLRRQHQHLPLPVPAHRGRELHSGHPHAWSPEGERYVKDQLWELARFLEKKTGSPSGRMTCPPC